MRAERAQEDDNSTSGVPKGHIELGHGVEQDLNQQAHVVHKRHGGDVPCGWGERLHPEDCDEAEDVAGETEGEDDPQVVEVDVAGSNVERQVPELLNQADVEGGVVVLQCRVDDVGVGGHVHKWNHVVVVWLVHMMVVWLIHVMIVWLIHGVRLWEIKCSEPT